MLLECSTGFFGVNCLHTCGKNFYGILCRNTCNCTETQFCHRECGCLDRLEYSKISITNEKSLSENLTSSYIAESCPTSTDAVVTSKSFTYCFFFHVSWLPSVIFQFHFLIATGNNVTQSNQGLCISYQFIVLILNTIYNKRPL